jgi:hypothetical protein
LEDTVVNVIDAWADDDGCWADVYDDDHERDAKRARPT